MSSRTRRMRAKADALFVHNPNYTFRKLMKSYRRWKEVLKPNKRKRWVALPLSGSHEETNVAGFYSAPQECVLLNHRQISAKKFIDIRQNPQVLDIIRRY